ncbi:hypothetical protein CLHOM_26090 [Clostridium homopropionicum DSM 5847]|uniref:Peptidase MA-like domain-containing protein n=1 Tax=Clostridium homopropionicum DSM 5847 TaxID=1121318 RepID=A0A0L6Z7C8_9CLOT|nr:hypothetical protein [Clostridium homopropionicum]KOA18869.1 hypothetical protein CLHOM_26090 [Clostridium homopropionicum DSM 5847]SFG46161.1 hypothetical protein SAMN04488501_109147 [Clostridium homopropionicum]
MKNYKKRTLNMNRKYEIFIISMCLILSVAVVQTLPVFILKPFGAKELKGENVIVYYRAGDEKGAEKIFESLEKVSGEIREKLQFKSSNPTEVYMYSSQKFLWIRKYGLITILGAPKWYIGDNREDKILIISPFENIEGHDYESIIGAATHELVHTINYQINPKLSYWNDNGVATFLSNQSPRRDFAKYGSLPTLEDMKSENEKRFGNIGGYEYSYSYIDFLNNKYGWDKVLDLIRGSKTYEEIFSKSEKDVYDEWIKYIYSFIQK